MQIRTVRFDYRKLALFVTTFFILSSGCILLARGLVSRAALEYNNAAIADVMLRYVGQNGVRVCEAASRSTLYAGECKQTVNCAISIASGGRQYPVGDGTYHDQFKNAGGIEVSSAVATKGDIIQVQTGQNQHTAVVLENKGNDNFSVVDSNYSYDGLVRVHDWTPPNGSRFWRMGTAVVSTGGWNGVKGLTSRATNTLTSGQVLEQNQFIVSPGGRYVLVMQGDGNLVMYSGTSAVWASGTGGNPGAFLGIQDDGNIVIYKSDRRTPLWATSTASDTTRLVMQDDGNLVAYNNNFVARWASSTVLSVADVKYIGSNTLQSGVWLYAGQYIRSADWRYTAIMQGDGNFVVYAAGGRAIWASGTGGNSGARLIVQGDGNMVIYRSDSRAIWASNTVSSGLSKLIIQNDGNLVGYTNSIAPKWASSTDGRF